jgi:hypothetical protein
MGTGITFFPLISDTFSVHLMESVPFLHVYINLSLRALDVDFLLTETCI